LAFINLFITFNPQTPKYHTFLKSLNFNESLISPKKLLIEHALHNIKPLHFIFNMKGLLKPKDDGKSENALRPPKIVVTNIIFLSSIFWVRYGHHILNYFYLF
jgi:hypothetical protein